MRRRLSLAAVLCCAVLLAAAGCADSPPPGRTTINDPGSAPSVSPSATPTGDLAPLTGLRVEAAGVATRPAVAVPVRIGAGSSAPAGLDTADLLFQEFAESGSLRMIGVYQSRDAAKVGPVHEIRPADVKTLPVLKPFIGYGGGPPSFVQQLENSEMPSVSRTSRSELFPGGYTATSLLYPAVPQGTLAPPSVFSYGGPTDQLAKTGVTPARQLTLAAPGRSQTWTYDEPSHTWRSDLGGLPVAVATVAVLAMPYKTLDVKNPTPHTIPSAEVLGEGEATVVSGSSVATGKWTKPALRLVCNVVDGAGYPMRPQPGSAWIVYAPPGTQVTAS